MTVFTFIALALGLGLGVLSAYLVYLRIKEWEN